MKAKNKQYFNIVKANAERGEIHIYGDIVSDDWRWGEETSAISFRDALKALESVEVIDVRINSGGGDVFEASAIYNMLKRHKARVEIHIDGLAASAASVIAMAGDKVTMPKNAMLMIHNAWTVAFGNHHDMRKQADDLEKINDSAVKQSYLSKSPGIEADEISRLMDAETWLTASEALEMGLIDEVVESTQVAASISDEQLARYKNTPSKLAEPEPLEHEGDNKSKLSISDEQINKIINGLLEKLKEETPKEPEQKPANKQNLSRLFLNL